MASISIRRAIPILIIVPLLTAVGLIGWLAFWIGEKAANDLVRQLTEAVGGRIEKEVIAYLERPSVINETLILAHQGELINTDNSADLEQYFWRETQQLKEKIFVFYGDEQGNYIGVDRLEDNSVTKVRDASTVPKRNTYRLDDRGNRADLISSEAYDPRNRPWYREAVQAGKPTWAEVYTSVSGKLVASAVAPIYTNSGKIKGVFGYDIALAQLSQFLQDIKISPAGEAFIIEQSGDLVASSAEEKSIATVDGKQERLHALKSQQPMIRRTTQNLLEKFGDLRTIQGPQSLPFTKGEREFVFVDRLEHDRGLDWLIVVVVPESDFMDHVHQQIRLSLLIGLAVAALSILLGLVAARWIIRPIEQLTQSAKDIEAEKFDLAELKPIIQRSDEFGELARVFENMADVVYSRQRQLQTQVKQMRGESSRVKKTALAVNLTERPYIEQLLQRSRKARGANEEELQPLNPNQKSEELG